MKFLMLRLESNIQSWGERSYWDERDTSDMPTKSGVIGLIACCMGLERDDKRIQYLYDETTMSVRIDDRGRILRDFQTIEDTVKVTGKLNPNKVVSPRYYLVDASFLAAIGSVNENLLNEISNAVKNPKWIPYLGRKCCVPSVPIFCGIVNADNAFEALKNKEYPVRYYDVLPEYIEFNIEGKGGKSKKTYKKRDVYGVKRFFRYRNVYEDYVKSEDFNTVDIREKGVI